MATRGTTLTENLKNSLGCLFQDEPTGGYTKSDMVTAVVVWGLAGTVGGGMIARSRALKGQKPYLGFLF